MCKELKMLIIHDKRLPLAYKESLLDKYPDAILQPLRIKQKRGKKRVYKSILYHPDIYFFQLDEKTLIHAPALAEDQLEPLKKRGITLIKGRGDPFGEYPDTVRFNAARVGKFVFHNFRYTDPAILEVIEKKGLEPVNVSQGYTRCSMLVASDNAIITENRGIFEAARERGIDSLLLAERAVLLPGEKYGFIGGSGTRKYDGALLMLGDLRMHPEVSRIEHFLNACRIQFTLLEDMPLYDAGGLVIAE